MTKLGFVTLTSIQAGIYICVSAIMAGHILLNNWGMKGAIVAIVVSSFILWLFSLMMVRLSHERPVVFIEIVRELFGDRGARLGGLAMGISLIGWCAIQTELMASGISSVFAEVPKWALIVALSALIVVNVCKGMEWMGRLANLSVPILLIIMSIAAIKLYDPATPLPPSSYNGGGIMLMIAFSLAGVIDIPTYFCVSRSRKDSYLATTIIYLLVLPAMAILGALFGWFCATADFVQGLLGLGGRVWQISVAVFILLAGWTTNNGNLYSAAKALAPSTNLRREHLVMALGSISTFCALCGFLERFETALSAMGIVMAALGGALVVYFLSCGMNYIPTTPSIQRFYQYFIVTGSLVGILSQVEIISMTGFGFIDSFLVTSILAIIFQGYSYANYKKRSERAMSWR